METITINRGDKQPLKCGNCDGFEGYCVADHLKTHYTTYYTHDGELEQGAYSDYQPVINQGVTAYCSNCGTRLKFKLRR